MTAKTMKTLKLTGMALSLLAGIIENNIKKQEMKDEIEKCATDIVNKKFASMLAKSAEELVG